ncbi:hypothetical protein [Litoreibacter ponti]|uniref:hypothetical protein n=1 Tax=Litoreibacter ponti TaxID=1510457 RepID=UPI001304D59D|nr:hypothetical protein [Litoreibacter ponti]
MPKTDCYVVTPLKGLLTRVLRSELSGTRVEAAPEDIIRRVGTYNRGVCAG